MSRILVLDTNILVSALWNMNGLEAAVMRDITEGTSRICVSSLIMEEYATVLYRPRLRFDLLGVQRLLRQISAEAIIVDPKVTVTASPDESDNRFLECAEAANAGYLVTGNKRHFPVRWKKTEILNARELLAKLNK